MKPLLRLSLLSLAISAALNAHADSVASSASSAGSDVSGSVSDSIHGSSNSSSNSSKDNKVADRDYHVVDVAQAPGKPGMARVTMQAADDNWQMALDVPQALVDREGLHAGAAVHAQQRVYGIEFEHAESHQGFFLALYDDWKDQMASRKVEI